MATASRSGFPARWSMAWLWLWVVLATVGILAFQGFETVMTMAVATVGFVVHFLVLLLHLIRDRGSATG